MKQKLLLLIFIVCLQFQSAKSQINFNEDLCYGSITNWSLSNTVAGHNSYSSGVSTISWSVSNNRWEISQPGFIDYYNNTNTSPNPPALGVGTWSSNGMCGGNILQLDGPFTTSAALPTVITNTPITNYGAITAVLGGNVTSDGGASLSDRGIVWGIAPNPTGNASLTGTTLGTFSGTVSSLPPGTTIYYRAYATNIAGTAYGNDVQFTTNAALSATQSQTNACSGINNGIASVTPSGGKSPYTYMWSNGSTTAGVTGLAPSNYSVLITDSEGISTLKNFTITQYTAITGSTVITNVNCSGGNTGAISLNVSGGSGIYTYNWGDGVTTEDRTGLAAGTYSVIITDSNGCTATISGIMVMQPFVVSGTTAVTDVSCFGGNTGAIDLTPLGGTPGTYTYLWNDGVITEDRTGLIAGSYTVVIRDVNNCPGTVIVTIGQPASALTTSAGIQVNVLCNGNATGEATVNATGGTGTYTYSWNTTPVQTTATATNLAAGTHIATVTDANGCTATQSFTITEPAIALTATAGAQTNVLCHGNATGAANVNATGGTGAYTYSWGLQSTPVSYCNSNFTNVTWEFIINVTFAGINNTSGGNTGAPVNYTAQIANVTAGNAYLLSVTIDPDSNDYLYAFIDWNQNGILNDVGEVYTLATNTSVSGPFTINVNVPANAVSGATRMRVLTSWNDSNPNPCRSATFGEAEDYTINVAASFNTGTNSISGVAAGTYIATVTDSNGCTATQSFTITEPLVLTASAGAQTNILCHGNATGEATVNATGGTGAYTYSWDTIPVQTTAMATGLAAGTYTATVTDANNCTATQSFTITEPVLLTASAGAQTNILCHGNATGQAIVNATGGTGAYSYSWDTTPAQTTAMATGLAAGTYTATVTDANNCTATQSFTITEPALLTASAGAQTNILCNGNATGQATVNATGGTGAYTYSWDTTPVQTTVMATGLAAGTYTATVTDANNCTATQSFTITEPATAMTLTPNTTQTDVLCNGQATGSATVAVTGGTGVYTYLWSNAATTNTITGLTAGTYTVDVTDANGCILSNSFTITQPAALVASAGTQIDVLCNGNATGSATVNATGGTGAYTYSWDTNPVQTTAMATGLAAGTYIATVYDANQCQTTQSFTITEPPVLIASAGAQLNVLCNGNATGQATVNVTGGTGLYTYSWDTNPVQITPSVTGLTAGTYTVTVTDSNLCTATQSFTITEPSVLNVSVGTQVDVLCFGNNTGSATVNATGGGGAYTYSWDTTPVQTTAMATGLAAGTYTATVTDANGCWATQSFTITEPASAMAFTPNTTQVDVLCNGQATGSATVAVNGGTGAYTYLWSNGGTANTITGLIAGTYTVTVTDANGCTLNNSFTITQPAALVATAGSQTNILCHGNATGEATVNVTGGTGAYTFNWSPSGGTAATATGLTAGTYTVTVYDANQCQTTQSFTITQPAQPLSMTPNTTQTNVSCFGGANGTASMAVTGGTSPYTYLWSNGQTNAVATGLVAGTYTVTATDANGCTITNSYTITEPVALVASAGPQINISCFGAANGSATVSATGGTGAYTYSWNTNPVQTTATATNLAPGNYTVTVYDANQCQATQSFTITEPQQLTAAVNNYANVLCYGAATGEATVSVSGGTTPYTYLWNTGQSTAVAANLTAGSYSVIVTDAHGCQANANVTITQPAAPLVATAGAQTNLICNGNTNGSATVNVTGGTGAYSYSWNTTPVQTTATATNLAAGTYTVTVYDANQCQTTQSFTITQPAAVAGSFTVTDADCYTPGSATIHASGGVGPYTYLWSNGNTTPNLENVAPGTYTVTISDTNGCSFTSSTTIYGTTPIIITAVPQSVTINEGETAVFTVEAQNVAYYQWQVSTNGGQSFSNLNSGGSSPGYFGVATPTLTVSNAYSSINGYLYRVIVMQQSGCYITSDAAVLNIEQTAGIDEPGKTEMSIYPNPASSEVFVKIPDFETYKNIALSIYDLNGRQVKNENNLTSEEYKIDVTGFESGVYIISITTDKGRTDKKLIVNKKL